MIEIVLIFICGWQSLDSNSGCPATRSVPVVYLSLRKARLHSKGGGLGRSVFSLHFYQNGVCKRWGRHVLSIVISIDYEECGIRILQVSVNFACYYRMPKDWNLEAYTWLQKYILKYSAGSDKVKWNMNIFWSHYSIGLKTTFVDACDKGPLFCLWF